MFSFISVAIIIISFLVIFLIISKKIPVLVSMDVQDERLKKLEKKNDVFARLDYRNFFVRIFSILGSIFERLKKYLSVLKEGASSLKGSRLKEREPMGIVNTLIDKLQRAKHLLSEGKIEDAEKAFIDVITQNPKNIDAYLGLGKVYLKMQNWDDARESFQHTLKLDPENIHAMASLGLVYYNISEYENALKFTKMACEKDPQSAHRYHNLGLIYEKLENFDEAMEMYEKTIELDPENQHYKIALETLKKRMEMEKS